MTKIERPIAFNQTLLSNFTGSEIIFEEDAININDSTEKCANK
jgi:hypothetical protein